MAKIIADGRVHQELIRTAKDSSVVGQMLANNPGVRRVHVRSEVLEQEPGFFGMRTTKRTVFNVTFQVD